MSLSSQLREARYFKDPVAGGFWRWHDGRMTHRYFPQDEWRWSIFHSPQQILKCLDVIETDDDGEPLVTERECLDSKLCKD